MTIRFTHPLRTEQIGHQRWRIIVGFSFNSIQGISIVVPAGFETDLASIPSITQNIVSKVGYWSQGAVVHDMLYYNHRTGLDNTVTRLQADNILLECCKVKAAEFNVSHVERRDWLIYGAVRVGGTESWETPEEKVKRLARNALPMEVLE